MAILLNKLQNRKMVKLQPLGLNPSQPPLVRGGAALALTLKWVKQAIRVADARTRGGWRGFWGTYCFLLTPCLAYAGLTWLKANGLQT